MDFQSPKYRKACSCSADFFFNKVNAIYLYYHINTDRDGQQISVGGAVFHHMPLLGQPSDRFTKSAQQFRHLTYSGPISFFKNNAAS